MLRVKRRIIKGILTIIVGLLIMLLISGPYLGAENAIKLLIFCRNNLFLLSLIYFLSAYLVYKQNKNIEGIVDLKKVHRMNKVLSIVDKLIGIYELLILWFGCYLLQSGLNIYLTLFLMAIYSYFLFVNRDKYS